MRRQAVLYVHGMGGSAGEAEHYKPLFPACDVLGVPYEAETPWEAAAGIAAFEKALEAASVVLIANSIGAFFSMCAPFDARVRKAFFISPVVDMEGLIAGRMRAAGVSEDDLRRRGTVRAPDGELSWDYLSWVRAHPITWRVPTRILYGENDALISYDTIRRFAEAHGAPLTVMKNGGHWFHTQEEMRFLDGWIGKG